MKIPRETQRLAKHYFRACLQSDGSINEAAVREIVGLIAQVKPRHYLALLNRLLKLVCLAVEARTVTIETAAPLADRGASIVAELQKQYGLAAQVNYTENPALIGGLRISRGSTIWDGTVLSRLERLKNAFN